MSKVLITLLLGVLLLVSCSPAPQTTTTPTPLPPSPPAATTPQLVVEPQWLKEHLVDTDIRVVDARTAARYREGHLPNAVNLPIADTFDPNHPIKGMVAPQAKIEPLLGNLGISNNIRVVVYDEGKSTAAARLLWTLEYYGHKQVSLLNGGFARWQEDGQEITREVPKISPTSLVAKADPSRIATREQVQANLGKKDFVLVDARTAKEFAGEDVRAKRGGHIPGAVNINWENNLLSGAILSLKPTAEMAKLYSDKGITRDKWVVTYCQTGQRASYAYLALRLLGYEKVSVYDGSWEEWGNDPSLPLEQ